ncbi:MAG TPA: hypothetical protein PLF13_01105 [candidate division Zixibacteria bacterium]|nr:hypothetical protein [candidate division Zixibacteria bacterium]
MNRTDFNLNPLVGLQRHSLRIMIILFAVSAALYSLGAPIATLVGLIGLGSLYLATVVKLVMISELFRKAHLHRLWMLSLALLLVLVAVVAAEYISI